MASRTERRARRAAEREGQEYVPVTERGEIVQAVRQTRVLLGELAELRNKAGDG